MKGHGRQEGFAQMQLQQRQVMTEYRQLKQVQAKKRQMELKEDIPDLKDQIDMAQSEEQQWFTDLNNQVLAVESRSRKDVGVAKEEL